MSDNFTTKTDAASPESISIETENNSKIKKGYKKFLFYSLLFGFAFWFSRNVYGIIPVVGQSMEKTFHNGDVCIAKMKEENINRYDVIIADIGSQNIIKRVIGLPGDKVQIGNGNVFINNEPVNEKYNFQTENPSGESVTYTVSDDEYFILGDNRYNSMDSRYFGCIKKEQILGKVLLRIYPFDDMCSEF